MTDDEKLLSASTVSTESVHTLPTDELVGIVKGAFTKLRDVRPYILELRKRFKDGEKNTVNHLVEPIAGCTTWLQFCEEHLNRSITSVRDLLHTDNPATTGGTPTTCEYCQLEFPSKTKHKSHLHQEHSESIKIDEDKAAAIAARQSQVVEQKQEAKAWIDFQPNFLSKNDADELFEYLDSRPEFSPETGSCDLPPTHDSLQWGPRQAYMGCVPEEFRIASSGEIPEKMQPLHEQIQQRYFAAFNSIQINRHWNENSEVRPHSDNMHGDIAMLSLGEPRRFVLRYKHDDKAKAARWKAGDIYFDQVLPQGSLLTIHKQHQFDLTHEMPKSDSPCGKRISVIWRYLTQSVVKGPLGKQSLIDGTEEFKQAQQRFLEAHDTEDQTDEDTEEQMEIDEAVDEDTPAQPQHKVQSARGVARGNSAKDITSFGGIRTKNYFSHEFVGSPQDVGITTYEEMHQRFKLGLDTLAAELLKEPEDADQTYFRIKVNIEIEEIHRAEEPAQPTDSVEEAVPA